MTRRAPLFLAAVLLAVPLSAAPLRFRPILTESAVMADFKHAVDLRLDLMMDSYKIEEGTESFKGLFTRAQPRLEYRYAPARNTEIFFRGGYTAQNVERRTSDGKPAGGERYSAGTCAPTIGFKLLLTKDIAAALHTTPATAAQRDPRLGDGTHDGVSIMFGRGPWHGSVAHTVRLPYDVHGATGAFRRDAGDLTQISLALTKRGNFARGEKDDVTPVLEAQALYADREKLDGHGVPGSAGWTGRIAVGFLLGRVNRHVTHLTSVSLSGGIGRGLHQTEDPLYGIGDLQIVTSYALYWD